MQSADPNLYIVRAGIHESLGDLSNTVADYETAVELNPALEMGLKPSNGSLGIRSPW